MDGQATALDRHAHRVDEEGHVVANHLDDSVRRLPAVLIQLRVVDPHAPHARAPLTQEIMFRAYFYPVPKRFIGRTEAIIFSSLVFAVIHNNAMALLPLCVLGILLALAYEFTGSIWAPIGIHTLFNGATVGAQLAIKYGLLEDPGL